MLYSLKDEKMKHHMMLRIYPSFITHPRTAAALLLHHGITG